MWHNGDLAAGDDDVGDGVLDCLICAATVLYVPHDCLIYAVTVL